MSSSPQKIQPGLPSGFRDYLPREMIVRNQMLQTIREVYERFGFDPLETPGMERRAVLTGGQDASMMIYETRTSADRAPADATDPRATALRFDLTVPLARVVAQYLGVGTAQDRQLRLPFRRYQMGSVWRGERPQAGRFREFIQCDADIVGVATPVADAEVIALAVTALQALGVPRFAVRFNNRKLLNALAPYAGFDPARIADVLRVLDKYLKIGRDGVLRELTKPQRPAQAAATEGEADTESDFGLGFDAATAARIAAFMDLSGSTDELLERSAALFAGVALAEEGIAELRSIVDALRAMGADERCWRLDLTIARGLGYYTGMVFETFLLDERGEMLVMPSADSADGQQEERFGSVCSGGRYDGLVSRFSDASIPATGASIGVDRLFYQLVRTGVITPTPTRVQALVTVMDPEHIADYLAITGQLRAAGIRTVLWEGAETSFKEQLSYAVAQEIPFVLIVGDDERASGTVAVKHMAAHTQTAIPRPDIVQHLLRHCEE
ncbi:MAG: histidine--tRNA ligase [bacterium]|nr:histidine--tRNA ligase [bacterium]